VFVNEQLHHFFFVYANTKQGSQHVSVIARVSLTLCKNESGIDLNRLCRVRGTHNIVELLFIKE
jgi:hypothetical protein